MTQEISVPPPSGPKEIVISDADNPRALINLVPEAVKKAINNLPPSFVNKSEAELLELFETRKFTPEPLIYRLRAMFWKEYDRAACNLTKMNMAHVYLGICSRDYFYVVLLNKEKVSFIMCPPVDYQLAVEEALIYGIEQLRDILSLRHTTIGGSLDARAAAAKVEIVKLLDSRVKGAIVMTTKNLNVNVQANSAPPTPLKPEELDQRIQELEQNLSDLNKSSTLKKETKPDIEV